MAAAVKLSQQLRTESCVVFGNGHCEAQTERLKAGTKVNGKIAPKSIVVGVADLVSQWGRQYFRMRIVGEYPGVLPGFVPPACSQRISCEQGRSARFKRSL